MLLNRRDVRGVSIFRTAVTIPMMVTDVAVGVIFGFYLYEYTFGLLNYMVGLLGIPPIAWIGDPISAMIAVILADVWRNTPFVVLLLIAGLQSLPRGPYEAAMIDGASRYRIFRQITVPMLLPIIGVVTILRVINAFQVFGLVYTSTRGGPGTATEIFTYYSFLNAFKYLQVGYAAASIFVLFIIVLAITLVLVKATRL
jgi:multiple sugar transport system permease protein